LTKVMIGGVTPVSLSIFTCRHSKYSTATCESDSDHQQKIYIKISMPLMPVNSEGRRTE
jgi:hypothetical protein